MLRAAADLVALQAYLRVAAVHHREVVRSGPFVLHLDAVSPSPGLNYAIPDDGTAPSRGQVSALMAAFAARELTPALEYLPALSPDAEGPLRAGGLGVEARIPVMLAPAADLVDVPPPLGVGIVVADSRTSALTLTRIVAVQEAAFGAPARVVEQGEVERLRRTARDGVVAFAYADGEVIAGGVALTVRDGFTELAGIGVDAAHRGRGIAGALTAVLAREAVARGARTPFLTPADEAAGRVYARAGFRIAGEMLHLRGVSG
ncbi:hypothetical protein DSM112329_03038 [Paraconexibacter sp. AEG42_29]|uniref:N-acetyltransferase domain-containing protein n=1 Tax=Paraconexibacter sp. AEG42_29 TaxID=2997339 RepID=A0AAU7AX37_9ACTN